MATHLFPTRLLLRKRIECLIQRVSDDSAHRLVPSPISIHTGFLEEVRERLLALLDREEPVMRDDGVVREVRSSREHAAWIQGKATCMRPHSEI